MTLSQQIESIVKSHALTMQEFKNYQRAMPEKRQLIHAATLDIYSKVKISENALAKMLGIDRGKLRRMKFGEDVNELPAHYSPDEIAILREMVKNGNDYSKIADAIGRSKASIVQMASIHKACMKRINPDFYRQRMGSGWELRTQF